MKKIIIYSTLYFFTITITKAFALSGNCGPIKSGSGTESDPYIYDNNCTYTYDADTKTLTISGEGKMADFKQVSGSTHSDERGNTPWRFLNYETVLINEGITSVGTNAFIDSDVKNAKLPETLTSIGNNAFHQSELENINLPDNISYIGPYALSLNNLSSVVLPQNLTRLSWLVLYGTNISSIVIPTNVTTFDDNIFTSGSITYATPLTTIYCSDKQMDQCKAAVAYRGDNIEIKEYQFDGNRGYFFDNKWYQSPNDIIAGNYIKKRIYTVEEATKVSKKNRNTFSIKYR